MAKHGPEFYDDDKVFETYIGRRNGRQDSPNDIIEQPIIDELAGSLEGLHILDLGCGDACYGRYALDQGCASYTGFDGSRNMITLAREQLAGTKATAVLATMDDYTYPQAAFDLAISRLAIHYVEDIDTLFRKVFGALVRDGRFIFSIEHPVITSSDAAWKTRGPRQHWIVDNYFDSGPRQTLWMNGEVIKYHRTIEEYFLTLQKAGFTIKSLRESRPKREYFNDDAQYQRRMRIPLMLFFEAEKA